MSTVYTSKGKGKVVATSTDKTQVEVEQTGGRSDGERGWWSLSELG
jgi:hypothetical protein